MGTDYIRGFAILIAVIIWAALAGLVLWRLEINPWWSALVGLVALGVLGLTHLVSSALVRAAAATYLERIERDKLDSVRELTDQDLAEIEEVWTGPVADIEPKRSSA